jgi:hypothetical protein
MTTPVNPKPSSRTFASVTITTAATGLSEAVNLTGLTLSSIQTSTAWTAAVLGFQGNVDGSTNYYNFYDKDGNLYYQTIDASRMVVFDPAVFAGVQTLRLISETTAGVVVAQAADREIKLGLSEYVKAD